MILRLGRDWNIYEVKYSAYQVTQSQEQVQKPTVARNQALDILFSVLQFNYFMERYGQGVESNVGLLDTIFGKDCDSYQRNNNMELYWDKYHWLLK